MVEVAWAAEIALAEGVLERGFVLEHASRTVPGVFWQPAGERSDPLPVMLLGHGGGGHKRHPRIASLARRLASTAQIAAVAIDGPYHGDRVPAPVPAGVYQPLIGDEGIHRVVARMVADWHAALELLASQTRVDVARVGYHGMSMGARFGLPLAASLGDRLRCLVLGKFGLQQRADMDPRIMDVALFGDAAAVISAPTLFHLQWDDAIFPREGQLELFDRIAAPDKRLLAYPGAHEITPDEALETWLAFAIRHLGSASVTSATG